MGRLDRTSKTAPAGDLVVGISGARNNGAAAVVLDGRLAAFCEQERLTRVRRDPIRFRAWPTATVDSVLALVSRRPSSVDCYAVGEADLVLPTGQHVTRLDHHFAHAATAYFTAPVNEAVVLICDARSHPPVSVWRAQNGTLENLHWRWTGPGFARLYSRCAALLGLGMDQPHRLEALARLGGDTDRPDLSSCFSYAHGSLRVHADWPGRVERALNGFNARTNLEPGAHVASALQHGIGRALLALVEEIHAAIPSDTLCVGGGLFYNTYFNTLLSRSSPFTSVFVAPNPGNAGIAAGAALAVGRRGRTGEAVSPFLGPEYDHETIKAALENCKLSYECLSHSETIATVVRHLMNGRLIGWFNGRMEWGHRSLGNRSILANPTSPYVLDNLNCFLKQGEPYPYLWPVGVRRRSRSAVQRSAAVAVDGIRIHGA